MNRSRFGEGVLSKFLYSGAGLCIVFMMLASWAQHVLSCIREEQWILLIVGAIVPPVGWLHGIAVWLGMV